MYTMAVPTTGGLLWVENFRRNRYSVQLQNSIYSRKENLMTARVAIFLSRSCPNPGSEWGFVVCSSGNKLCYYGQSSERIGKI